MKSPNFIFLLFIFIASIFNKDANAQTKQKKNLGEKNEVFFMEIAKKARSLEWSDADSLITSLNEGIDYYNKTNNNCNLSFFYALKGRVYLEEGRKDSSLISFIKASQKDKESCPDTNQYFLYNSWTLLYLLSAEYSLADSLSNLALDAAINSGVTNYHLNILTNRSILYTEIDQVDKAISIMKELREIATEENIEYHIWSSLQNLGAFYCMKEDYDSSIYYFDILKNKITDDTPGTLLMGYYNNLAVIYEEQGELEIASEHYAKATEIAKENQKLDDLVVFLKNYSNSLSQIGKHEESRQVLLEYTSLKDSLLNSEKIRVMKDLEKKYELSKQKEKIAQLEKDQLQDELTLERTGRTRDVFGLIIIGVVVFAIALYRRLRYIRKSKRILEQAKKRSDDLLLNILPEKVAQELKKKGKTDAKYHDNISVLFTDFVKFTEFTQQLSAEDLVAEIDYCFQKFDNITSKYSIEKIKTIGDAYMAAGGIGQNPKEAATNTILAALEMQAFLNARFEERAKQGLPNLRMRSGIHSGKVVAGIVGVKKFQYDIWGDTVNTASRMESYGEAGKVNISSSTYDIIKEVDKFSFEARGKIEVKGKGLIEMYYVTLKSY